MNAYRTPAGKLDRTYLRLCAAYKLLSTGRIGADRAVEIMEAGKVAGARKIVGHWLTYPKQGAAR